MTHLRTINGRIESVEAARGGPAPRWSERLWDLRWEDHLPWQLDGGIRVQAGSLADATPFIRDHYADIFELGAQGGRFLSEPMTPAKERFVRESDVFLFRDGERLIGILMCNPSDWSTYYMRSAAFLPEYQSRGLLGSCVERTFDVLRDAGCARVEVEAAPSNFASIRLLTRLGFNVTSMTNSERFGTIIRFTKFLLEDAETVFLDQFCSGVRYQRRRLSNKGRRPS